MSGPGLLSSHVGDAGQLVAGDYRLAESIGTGGMGVVWRARDEAVGRDVAVKEIIFPIRIPEDERQRACARSVQEARAAAQLGHPGIITVHGGVEHDGRAWVVMFLLVRDGVQRAWYERPVLVRPVIQSG
jgi:serine/threonine protein kinase